MMDDLDNKHILTGLFDNFWKPIFAKLRTTNPSSRSSPSNGTGVTAAISSGAAASMGRSPFR